LGDAAGERRPQTRHEENASLKRSIWRRLGDALGDMAGDALIRSVGAQRGRLFHSEFHGSMSARICKWFLHIFSGCPFGFAVFPSILVLSFAHSHAGVLSTKLTKYLYLS
jgi:hypothetical protein